ncbi:hypothetical protein ONZ43_g4898 [Nemania bipapillata]|uniref:Uncharacterized protein n=1 Tax=Nemania bipapillata TaxID=110536 RepID=A0ACC2IH23_9PEZI|nr:hypothetical protein ONZ43_g4898 [Nemania bipapillata]
MGLSVLNREQTKTGRPLGDDSLSVDRELELERQQAALHAKLEAAILAAIESTIRKATTTETTTVGLEPTTAIEPAGDKDLPSEPLVERIRIKSQYILKILDKIHGESWTSGPPLVMIRPYKTLAYYDQRIRQKFQDLKKRFANEDVDPTNTPTTVPSDIPAPDEFEGTYVRVEGVKQEARDVNVDEDQDEYTSSLTAYKHLKCLVEFMDDNIQRKLQYIESDRCQTVTFSDIWYLFRPGLEVIEQTRRQAYRILSISSAPHKVLSTYSIGRWTEDARIEEETPVWLHCVYIDFDGKSLGPVLHKVKIPKFEGEKAVTALEVFPLRFAEKNGSGDRGETDGSAIPSLRQRLIARGKMLLDVTTPKHMHYSGLTLDTRDEIDSHVVIDFEEAFLQQNSSSTNTGSENQTQAKLDLSYLSLPENSSRRVRESIKSEHKGAVEVVGQVRDAPGTTSLLPKGHKEMVKSLIAQHFREKESASKEDRDSEQIDIVRGKGDLGTSASEVEKALETHFSLANKWGCILLLDEADVFLAARSKTDFPLMSTVFLRVLEYYAGILFLTTNRVGDFDEAFASRIHISLYYLKLDIESTAAIFKLNLGLISDRFRSKQRSIRIEESEILEFARSYFTDHPSEQWNGRQIRNACQTALALAEYRAQGSSHEPVVNTMADVVLKKEDLETVSTAYLEFIKYLNKVRGKDAEKWAKLLNIRALEKDIEELKVRPVEIAPRPPAPNLLPASAAAAAAQPIGAPHHFYPPPNYPAYGYGQNPAYGGPPPEAPPPSWPQYPQMAAPGPPGGNFTR